MVNESPPGLRRHRQNLDGPAVGGAHVLALISRHGVQPPPMPPGSYCRGTLDVPAAHEPLISPASAAVEESVKLRMVLANVSTQGGNTMSS